MYVIKNAKYNKDLQLQVAKLKKNECKFCEKFAHLCGFIALFFHEAGNYAILGLI